MSLNAPEIQTIAGILTTSLCPAATRRLISPNSPNRIVIELRSNGDNHYLQIVLSTNASRIGRISHRPRSAPAPHPFVMLLRRELDGRILEQVEQLNGDRVVALLFRGKTDHRTLLAELTGRHGNLFLLDHNNRILGSFHPNLSQRRLLVPGEPYVAPAPKLQAAIASERFDTEGDLEHLVEAHYRALESQQQLAESRTDVLRLARLARKRNQTLLDNLAKDLARARQGDAMQETAHLIQGHLHQIQKGMTSLNVVDYSGAPVTISLNPSKDPVTQMQQLFDRARRLRRAAPDIDRRFEQTTLEHEEIADALSRIQTATPDELTSIRDRLTRRYPDLVFRAAAGASRQPERLPYREFSISGGHTARVGKSAADNDALTLRHARPGDLWLHVRGIPGSHVIVPLGRGEQPGAELLIDAAHLAVHFSSARDDDDVEIIHTLRKYVQKPRGSAPGSVRLLKEKTLILRKNPGRLREILGKH